MAAMPIRDPSRERKPEPGAAPAASDIRLEIGIENPGQIGLRYARTIVADRDARAIAVRSHIQPDHALGRREFYAIIDDGNEGLAQSIRIADDRHRIACRFKLKPDTT